MELGWIGTFGNLFFWLIVLIVVAGVVWLIYANRHVFSGGGRVSSPEVSKVRTVAGMDVRLESLPSDIVGAAKEAWEKGDKHLALSLLYRGSIAWLVNYGGVVIGEGDTEMDCERAVLKVTSGEVSRCFKDLTRMWVRLAYGKLDANEGEFASLCNDWPFKGYVLGGVAA